MQRIKKNLLNIFFLVLVLVIVFIPDAKAFLLKGLMEIGLYRPQIEKQQPIASDLSGIRFSDMKGDQIDLGDLKGKVIFLNFWATWCPPCRAELPSINKLFTQFKDDPNFVFIFADADGNLSKAGKFMSDKQYSMPVYKVETAIPEQIFAGSLPTTVIFDKEGRLCFHHEGMADYSDKRIIDFLNKLRVM